MKAVIKLKFIFISGIFTTSLTGVYLFTWVSTARKLAGECSYDIWVKLMVNGNYKISAAAESMNDWNVHQGSSTAVLRLTKGGRVLDSTL